MYLSLRKNVVLLEKILFNEQNYFLFFKNLYINFDLTDWSL